MGGNAALSILPLEQWIFFRVQDAEIGHLANLVNKQLKVDTWFLPALAKCEALGLAGSGLPLGLQLIAARFQEERRLSAARWCEKVLDVQLTPPIAE